MRAGAGARQENPTSVSLLAHLLTPLTLVGVLGCAWQPAADSLLSHAIKAATISHLGCMNNRTTGQWDQSNMAHTQLSSGGAVIASKCIPRACCRSHASCDEACQTIMLSFDARYSNMPQLCTISSFCQVAGWPLTWVTDCQTMLLH